MATQQTFRIDIHHHFAPPEYVAALARTGVTGAGGEDFPDWNPEQTLAMMDRQGIATALLSLSAPGVFFGNRDLARDLARMTNEFAARMVSNYPLRLGFFATLPLPNVDDAALELDYTMDTLHADGVILLSNYAGQYPGDPAFEPLFGSDYPWVGEALASLVLLRLESYPGIDQQARRAIERDNALTLFPRLAAAAPVSAG